MPHSSDNSLSANYYVTHGEFTEFKDSTNNSLTEIKGGLATLQQMIATRGTNWGWVFGGLTIVVVIVLALGKGFVDPLDRDVSAVNAIAVSNAKNISLLVDSTHTQLVENSQWVGEINSAMAETSHELDRIQNLALGDGSPNSGWMDRLARIEQRTEEAFEEQSQLREAVAGVLGARFGNE